MIVIEEGNDKGIILVMDKQKSPNVLVELVSDIEEIDWQYSNSWWSKYLIIVCKDEDQ